MKNLGIGKAKDEIGMNRERKKGGNFQKGKVGKE